MNSTHTPLLKEKVIIVTGAGAGLGLAYAKEIARQGGRVVLNDVDAASVEKALEDIRSTPGVEESGGGAVAAIAPVGDSETAELLVRTAVDTFGRLDGLVTNAGILRDRSLLKMSDEDFDAVVRVHLRGTFTCVRAAYEYFKGNNVDGRIVCIGSPTGQRGNFGQTNYAAAKAGIVGMVRTWALEMKRARVGVNAVIPVAATAMTRTVPYFSKAIEAIDEGREIPGFFRHDLGFGTAEDVAGVIAYLCSSEAEGITGQVIGVGGDRLQVWTHPEPVIEQYHDGGWTAADMLSSGGDIIRGNQQSIGEKFPELPEGLKPREENQS
ncbi:SDR family oxidoreductase [Corynebacterium uropygiale]|uniref:SDR family oxidoreductase n=1 Tax=Corynebacterium uropygiale TaxID=1775911 RepID=A0A9X1QQK8_9CORY|nr:SDR family NAD(P)-dependent oxidoreductase [Corynebacterium uropygiale]MCF4007479.1 SDR family oxidoreductase [Corynebacterium uropygiale]